MAKVKRALVSVSDKTGLVEFGKGLAGMGVEILSTGGTARALKEAGVPVRLVSEYTGFPEMLGGRVKTLHPKVHGALLARRENPEDMKQCADAGIELIDLVVVNLYPFRETVSREGISIEEAVEQIDIGGPTMLRSAAKNYRSVAVIVSPERYGSVLKELGERKGELSIETLQLLAQEVFAHTASYDSAIRDYLGSAFRADAEDGFPQQMSVELECVQGLRYGENPHQKAAFYGEPGRPGIAGVKQLHGKELSFNNILDLDSAWAIACEFTDPAAAVIKHTNPCGAATGNDLARAYEDAYACDTVSAFGSIVGLNREVDEATAGLLAKAPFIEAIIAPGFSAGALAALKSKKNLRLLVMEDAGGGVGLDLDLKRVAGGMLAQERDRRQVTVEDCRVVTKRKPSEEEFKSLLFSWCLVKHVKSNAILLVQGTRSVGVGAGQMSRVDSTIIATRKAGELAKGSVLASDAFMPFRDAADTAAAAGVKAMIQPGGAKNDEEVIAACDEHGMAMVFTGMRHFKH